MSLAEVVSTETGLSVSGKIQFGNVVALRRQGNRAIARMAQQQLAVDLSGVTSSDSSGLSLLLCWLRYAKQQGKAMRFTNMSESLSRVAEVCGVASLLGVSK